MMKKQILILKQLDRKFEAWRHHPEAPGEGWVRLIRKAIGMTTGQLAKRLGVNRSRVVKIEQAEPDGSLSVRTLQEVADALNCKLVYALVPKEPLREMIEKQAKKIAAKRLGRVAHSMLLEEQSVEAKAQQEQLQELINELLAGSFKHLWDEE
jgi:predicted DNA-binding mobile mystery protein A